MALVRVLGINGHWLLTGEGDPNTRPGDADHILRDVRRLVFPISLTDPEKLLEEGHDLLGAARPEGQEKSNDEQNREG